MNEFETVKHLLLLHNATYKDVGYNSASGLSNRLSGKHIYVDTWRRILDNLGYEVVVRKKDKTGSEFVITDDDFPSPLRFQGMSLNFEKILGDKL